VHKGERWEEGKERWSREEGETYVLDEGRGGRSKETLEKSQETKNLVVRRAPGLPIRDFVASHNNRVPRRSKMSAIDVTAIRQEGVCCFVLLTRG